MLRQNRVDRRRAALRPLDLARLAKALSSGQHTHANWRTSVVRPRGRLGVVRAWAL
jgi:hypothetical protein